MPKKPPKSAERSDDVSTTLVQHMKISRDGVIRAINALYGIPPDANVSFNCESGNAFCQIEFEIKE